jgi:hypothetical protein
MLQQIKWHARTFWRCNVRGTPATIAISGTALAITIWFQLPRWILWYDGIVLALNLWAYDYRRRHNTLPVDGIDDDEDDIIPPPPTKEK